ncbi:hypothetical protein WA1_18610 [Scytonema hofmannii PCC 7110]|uniref:DNA-binding protein n=1 Tax=Scytonema hofmannii PCC 7110 TaxID=128403 RepID=A0A139XBE0_9CYAN|nr:hypothetical protein [Scytonema hofmannii]KYC42017.1 hypothetical protein WA1_18610 [Scytonema hofmannii PCC 7110]
MTKLDIEPIHPRQFKELHGLSLYQLHRLTQYPQETIRNWLADPESERYVEPKVYVKRYFGLLHQSLQANRVA